MGTIQVAQHSLSNFAPFAPVVDLINLPYFCGVNQKFINLVTSDIWKKAVDPMVEAKGFKPLWYVVIDPRVVAMRKGGKGPVKTPDDLSGVKFRVPGSKMLQQYYRMLGANPTPVAWGETPAAIKQGRRRCSGSGGGCALRLRLQRYSILGQFHPSGAGFSGLFL